MTFPRLCRSRLAAVVAASVLALATGCSESKSDGKSGAGSEPDGSAACRLLSRSEVQSALGVNLQSDGQSEQVGPASNCDWRTADQFVRVALVQANSTGDAAQTFDVLDDRPGAAVLPNLGDKAVFLASTPEAKNAQLFILTGDRMITVSYCCATENQLVDLGRKALDRLG
jgi:hypothetical protein